MCVQYKFNKTIQFKWILIKQNVTKIRNFPENNCACTRRAIPFAIGICSEPVLDWPKKKNKKITKANLNCDSGGALCVRFNVQCICVWRLNVNSSIYIYFSLLWWQNIRKSFSFCSFVRTLSEKKNKLIVAFDRNYAFHLALNLMLSEFWYLSWPKKNSLIVIVESSFWAVRDFGCFGFWWWVSSCVLVCVCVFVHMIVWCWLDRLRRNRKKASRISYFSILLLFILFLFRFAVLSLSTHKAHAIRTPCPVVSQKKYL